MSLAKPYFTTKTAVGSTFCNREKEREQLKLNIQKGEHTVVVAPRRFGKTSLVYQSLEELGVECTKIDLFCTVYATTVAEKITKGVSGLVKQLMPFSTKAMEFIESCFKQTNIVLKAGEFELQVNFSKIQANPIEQIVDVLTGLEKIAQHQKKRVVVFIDEFQDMLKADQSDEIQAAIRNVAQHAHCISFIFSGSSRNMLRQIFEDRNQPLYMLCQKIHLKKIEAKDFEEHLQKLAKKHWKQLLEQSVIDCILNLSECHPYYLNVLCDKLWDKAVPPKILQVNDAWELCLNDQKDKLIADLEPLNAIRIKVLTTIALRNGVDAPNGKNFIEATGLSLGTVQKALHFLSGNDFIFQEDNSKRVNLVDPLLKKFIIFNSH